MTHSSARSEHAFQRTLGIALHRQLFAQWPWLVALGAIGPLLHSVALAPVVPPHVLYGWLGCCAISTAFGAAVGWYRRRLRPADYLSLAPWLSVAALLHGLEVGIMTPLFLDPEQMRIMVMVAATMCGIAGVAVVALHAYPPAMFAMLAGVLLPPWLFAWSGQVSGLIPTITLPFAFTVFALWGWRGHVALRELISLRLDNRRLTRAARRDRQAAERADRAKSRFLAVATHDLRQPTHGLLLQLEALQLRTEGDAAVSALVVRINRSAQALSRLLNGLWDLSKLEANAQPMRTRPVDLEALLDQLVGEYRERAVACELSLRLRVAAGLHVQAEPVSLQRSLRNLLENALRYTERGGILVAARRRGNEVLIEIWDTGVGIRREDQAQVFEEFFRASSARQTSSAGLGLGLAVAKRLAARLGGRLALRSQPDRGSRFSLSLPMVMEADSPPASLLDGSSSQSVPTALQGGRILLLDPDIDTREALAAVLRAWNCEVLPGDRLDVLLTQATALPQAPNLLISNFRLDDPAVIDGVAAIERLRDEFNQPTPGLVLSADTGDDVRRRVEDGECRLVVKPIEPSLLRALLGQLLAGTASADDTVLAEVETG